MRFVLLDVVPRDNQYSMAGAPGIVHFLTNIVLVPASTHLHALTRTSCPLF